MFTLGSTLTGDILANCNLKYTILDRAETTLPVSCSSCGLSDVNFNFTEYVPVETKLTLTCTGITVPATEFPARDAVLVPGSMVLSGRTLKSMGVELFKIDPLPYNFTTDFATTASLSSYRVGAHSVMTLSWQLPRSETTSATRSLELTQGYFTGIDDCVLSPTYDVISLSSSDSTIMMSNFIGAAGDKFTLTCNVKTAAVTLDKTVATLNIGGDELTFVLPQEIVQRYETSMTLSDATVGDNSTAVFTLTPFVDMDGFVAVISSPLFASGSCQSSAFAGSIAFNATTHELKATFDSAPANDPLSITCTFVVGPAYDYSLAIVFTHSSMLEAETYYFPELVSAVDAIPIDVRLSSKHAQSASNLRLTFTAPLLLMDDYSTGLVIKSQFTEISACFSDDMTIDLNDDDVLLMFLPNVIRGDQVRVDCNVTNSAVGAAFDIKGSFIGDGKPKVSYVGKLVERVAAVTGATSRESLVADATTVFNVMFTATENLDGQILRIYTQDAFSSFVSNSCTVTRKTVVPDTNPVQYTQAAAGSVALVPYFDDVGIATTFTAVAVKDSELTITCTVVNSPVPVANVTAYSYFSLDGRSSFPLDLPLLEVTTSYVVATFFLENKRALRADTGFTISFMPSLPPAGYTLELPLQPVFTTVDATSCELSQASVWPVENPDSSSTVNLVGTVTYNATTFGLSVHFRSTAVKWELVTLKCRGTLAAASAAQTVYAQFTPASTNSTLPVFDLRAEVMQIIPEIVITPTTTNHYVNESSSIAVPITITETTMEGWMITISTTNTFITVSNCYVTVPGVSVNGTASDPVSAGTVTVDGTTIKATLNDQARKDAVVTVSCFVQNYLRKSNIRWLGVASKTGSTSFEYGFTAHDILYRPPTFDALLSSSIYDDYLVTLTMTTLLTLPLEIGQELSLNMETLFPGRATGKQCSIKFGSAATRSRTIGTDALVFTVDFFDVRDINTLVEIICRGMTNPKTAAEVVPITGMLAGEVPLSISVKNTFVTTTVPGAVVASSYTSGTTNVELVYEFVTQRDLNGYAVRIVPLRRFNLTTGCAALNLASTFTLPTVAAGEERIMEVTIGATTNIGDTVKISCVVNLGEPSNASTYTLSFTKTSSKAVPVAVTMRYVVPAPVFVGSLSSSILGDTSVVSKISAPIRFPIASGNTINFNYQDQFTLSSDVRCAISINNASTSLTVTSSTAISYTFTSAQANLTVIGLDCVGLRLPTAAFTISGVVSTTEAQYSYVYFSFAYTNTLVTAHALGNTTLSTYLPSQSGVTMVATFKALKDLSGFAFVLSATNRMYINSCESIPSLLTGASNTAETSNITLTFSSSTTVNQEIAIQCVVRTLAASAKSNIIGNYYLGSTSAAGSGTVQFELATIVYSYTGTVTQSSNVQGEINTLAFTFSALDDLTSRTLTLDLATVATTVTSCDVPETLVSHAATINGTVVSFVFTGFTTSLSVVFTCVVINSVARSGSELRAVVTHPTSLAAALPVYFSHSGLIARALTDRLVQYESFAAAGSRTTLTLKLRPNFIITSTMLIRFPLPAHIITAASQWPITCTVKVGTAGAVAVTPITGTKFSFTGVSSGVAGVLIEFNCLNFPLPATPMANASELLLAVVTPAVAANTTAGTAAVAEQVLVSHTTTVPAYPAIVASAFGGETAIVTYDEPYPNARTSVTFTTKPSLTSAVTVGWAISAELAFEVTLHATLAMACTLTDGTVSITGTTSATRSASSGVISISWAAASAGTLDASKAMRFRCTNVVMPAGLRSAAYYGSLSAGPAPLRASHYTSEAIVSAQLAGLFASFSPNIVGTATAAYTINSVGVDLIAGNTLVVPVPEGTTLGPSGAVVCRVGTSNAFSATLQTTLSRVLATVPQSASASKTDSFNCTGLAPPRSTLASISTTNQLAIYRSQDLDAEFAHGSVTSPVIVAREITTASDLNTVSVDPTTSTAVFVMQGFSFSLIPSSRITISVPADLTVSTCTMLGSDRATALADVAVTAVTSSSLVVFTFASSVATAIPAHQAVVNSTDYIYVVRCINANVPAYIVAPSSTLTTSLYFTFTDKLSSAPATRFLGVAAPDMGTVAVNTMPWPSTQGSLVITWSNHSFSLTAGDAISVSFTNSTALLFDTQHNSCAVRGTSVTALVTQSTSTGFVLTVMGAVPAAMGTTFMLTCSHVTTATVLGQEPATASSSLSVLRLNNAAQVKATTAKVTFPVLVTRPLSMTLTAGLVTPSSFSSASGTLNMTLRASDTLPPGAQLVFPLPTNMWTVTASSCTGSIAGAVVASSNGANTNFVYSFYNVLPAATTFTLSCTTASSATVFRPSSSVIVSVTADATTNGTTTLTVPAVVGTIGTPADVVLSAPRVGALTNITVRLPSIAAPLASASIAIGLPAGTSRTTSAACTLTPRVGETPVTTVSLSGFTVTSNTTAFTTKLTLAISGTMTTGTSLTLFCTGFRAPLAVAAASNTTLEAIATQGGAASDAGQIAARTQLISAGVTAFPNAAATFSFGGTAGSTSTLSASLSAIGFDLPINSVLTVAVPPGVTLAAGTSGTACVFDDTVPVVVSIDSTTNLVSFNFQSAVTARTGTTMLALECIAAFVLPSEEIVRTSAEVILYSPTGQANLLTPLLTAQAPFTGIKGATLQVEIAAVNAQVNVSTSLRFNILPMTVNAAAGDSLIMVAPIRFTYVANANNMTTACLLSTSSQAVVRLTIVANPSDSTVLYTLLFVSAANLRGTTASQVTCSNIRTPSAAVAEARGLATLKSSAGAVRGSGTTSAIFSPIIAAAFATQWSRIIPQSTIAGSDYGMLTVLLSPLTSALGLGSTFIVTLPPTWSITPNAITCAGSFGNGNRQSATLTFTTYAPTVVDAANKVLRVSAPTMQFKPTDSKLRIFCDNAVRVPAVATAAVTGPFVSIIDASNNPLLQALNVEIPAITATAVSVNYLTFTVQFYSATSSLSSDDIRALTVIFGNIAEIPLDNVFVRSQAVSSSRSLAAGFSEGLAIGLHGTGGVIPLDVNMVIVPVADHKNSIEDLYDMVSQRSSTLLQSMNSVTAHNAQTIADVKETAFPATCANGVKDNTETDIDCGGSSCLPCLATKACSATSDCHVGTCTGGYCTGKTSAAAGLTVTATTIVAALVAMIALLL